MSRKIYYSFRFIEFKKTKIIFVDRVKIGEFDQYFTLDAFVFETSISNTI